MRGFVEQLAIRLDPSGFGVIIVLRHLVKGVLETHHVAGEVIRVRKNEKRLGRDIAASGEGDMEERRRRRES